MIKGLHIVLRWFSAFLSAVLVVLVLAILLLIARLSWQPLVLDPWLEHIHPYLKFGEVQLTFKHVEVSLVRGLRLTGDGVKLSVDSGVKLFTLDNIVADFSRRSLLTGTLALKRINAKGANVEVAFGPDGWSVGSYYLPTSVDTQVASMGVVEFLNQWPDRPSMAHLREIHVEDLNLQFADISRGVDWRFEQSLVQLTRPPNQGEFITLTGELQQLGQTETVPVEMEFEHALRTPKISAKLKFAQSDTKLIRQYLPTQLQDKLKTSGRVELGAEIGLKNQLSEPWFVLDLDQTVLSLPKAYHKPLIFERVLFKGRYEQEQTAKNLIVHELVVEDTAGFQVSLSGSINHLSDNPYFDLALRGGSTTLPSLVNYLPDVALASTSQWLAWALPAGDVSALQASYRGHPLTDFPGCGAHCGVDVSFEVSAGVAKFLNDISPAENVSATVNIIEDEVRVSQVSGQIKDQQVNGVAVTVDGLFTADPGKVRIQGKMHGQLEPVLNQLEKALDLPLPVTATGSHASQVDITFPLGHQGRIPIDKIAMQVQSDLSAFNVLDIPEVEGVSFSSPVASLSINKGKLLLSAKGQLNDMPAHLQWQESINKFGQKTKLTVEGEVSSDALSSWLPKKIQFTGAVPATIVLQKKQKNAYDFALDANMQPVGIEINDLNWYKNPDQALNFKAEGQLRDEQGHYVLDVQVLSAIGDGVEILGNVFYAPHNANLLAAQLTPFKIGRTNIDMTYHDQEISFIGSELDLSKIDLFGSKEPKSMPENRKVVMDINTIHFAHGLARNVQGFGDIRNYRWHEVDVKASFGNDQQTLIQLTPRVGGPQRDLVIYAADAGVTLRTLTGYEKLNKGVFDGRIYLEDSYQGTGELLIRDARIVDAPVIAKLLSLISLEQLLTSGKGILFSEIKIPMKIQGDLVNLSNVRMSGPSIGLRFDGYYNYAESLFDLDGRLIPVAGINSFISSIPLVGDILTGSQEGLLVADFTVKGPRKDPQVSVNPLSVVTPGLVKDFFSVLTGGDREKAPSFEETE